MSIDERLETITRNLDMLTKIHLDNDREYDEHFRRLSEAQERLSAVQERLAVAQERNTHDIQALTTLVERDGENIRALARIAELHQQRLDHLEER